MMDVEEKKVVKNYLAIIIKPLKYFNITNFSFFEELMVLLLFKDS